jgi:hypothetical protein
MPAFEIKAWGRTNLYPPGIRTLDFNPENLYNKNIKIEKLLPLYSTPSATVVNLRN